MDLVGYSPIPNGGIDAKIETFETMITCEWEVRGVNGTLRFGIAGPGRLPMITAVVQPIVPILNQNGAHASSPVVDAQFTTDTIANVETHL